MLASGTAAAGIEAMVERSNKDTWVIAAEVGVAVVTSLAVVIRPPNTTPGAGTGAMTPAAALE